MSEGVEDLFGQQLEKEAKQAEWEDGVYTVTGKSMKKGIYRAGRWEGRPFARFLYEMEMPSGEKQQVSQMLPWLPGKAFFEINFKLLTGMSLSDFNAYCRSEGFDDASAQSKFFLERFRDVEYEVEIRKSDRWYNVWEIKRRIGDESPPEKEQPEAGTAPAAEEAEVQQEEDASQASGEMKEVSRLKDELQMSNEELEEICQEEFAVPLSELDASGLATLSQLMAERLRGSEVEPPQSDQALTS